MDNVKNSSTPLTTTIGSKYEPHLEVVEIAALLRKDLQKFFPKARFFVRTGRVDGGAHITVCVVEIGNIPILSEINQLNSWQRVYSPEFVNLVTIIERLADDYRYKSVLSFDLVKGDLNSISNFTRSVELSPELARKIYKRAVKEELVGQENIKIRKQVPETV